MPDQVPMPSDLEQLPLPELQSLVEALTAEPESRRTVLKAVQLTAISVEVGRRLEEAEDDDAATLRELEQILRQWLDNDRRMRGWNNDDDGFRGGGTCMCSIAREKPVH